jgi:hypothetical protein
VLGLARGLAQLGHHVDRLPADDDCRKSLVARVVFNWRIRVRDCARSTR